MELSYTLRDPWEPETPKMEPLNVPWETRQCAEPIKVTYMTVDKKTLEAAAVGKSFKQSVQGLHGHVIHVYTIIIEAKVSYVGQLVET